jgi:hypothetical protein
MDDLALVIAYLQHQWLPPEVKDAVRRLEHRKRFSFTSTGLGPAMVETPNGRYYDAQESD